VQCEKARRSRRSDNPPGASASCLSRFTLRRVLSGIDQRATTRKTRINIAAAKLQLLQYEPQQHQACQTVLNLTEA
jgi:hypothetical protein